MKLFPMLDGPPISWEEAEKVYKMYSYVFGNGQSLERIAQRGGFGHGEIEHIKKAYDRTKERERLTI